jgi:hypothetical protein
MAANGDKSDCPPPPILPYGKAPRRLIPKLALRMLVAVGMLLVIAALMLLAADLAYPPIPWRYMTVLQHDVDGTACIQSPSFLLLYEGYSFGSHVRSGGYIVDGRYANNPFRKDFATPAWINGEPSIGYSQGTRTMTVEYANTRAVYDDIGHRLTIGGRRYSTEKGPVALLIKQDGTVVEHRPATLPAGRELRD